MTRNRCSLTFPFSLASYSTNSTSLSPTPSHDSSAHSTSSSDDDRHGAAEDPSSPPPPSRRPPNRPVLGVRCLRLAAPHGLLHDDRSLAGLHLLRHRPLRATSARTPDWLVGHPGRYHGDE